MNKNFFITLILASIIMFFYSSLSWMVLGIHKDSMRPIPNSEAVMASLSGLKDGNYSIPMHPENASEAEIEKFSKENQGKPWAMIQYHNSANFNMGPHMLMGFLLTLASVFIALFMMSRMRTYSFFSRFSIFSLFGVILVLQSVCMQMIFFETPSHFAIPEIIDGILSWTLAGLLVGWLYKPSQD